MRAVLYLVTAVLLTANIVHAGEHKYLKAFHKAENGSARFVIELPHKERGEEDAFRVEITTGRQMMTDGVNNYRLGGSIKPMPLKGWGFTYYDATISAQAASTRIGVPPGTPQEMKFVPAASTLIRYNSRIPVVVYAPEDAEVRYRIWKAPEKFEAADKK